MTAWFARLAPREQRLVAIALPLVLLMLGWAFVWHPLAERRAEWRERTAEMAADVAWMRHAAPALGGGGRTVTEGLGQRSLLAVADSSLRESGLGGTLRRIEPVSEQRVRVWFEQVAFDAAVGWLEGLERRFGVQVSELSATRREGVGIVDLRVTLDLAKAP